MFSHVFSAFFSRVLAAFVHLVVILLAGGLHGKVPYLKAKIIIVRI